MVCDRFVMHGRARRYCGRWARLEPTKPSRSNRPTGATVPCSGAVQCRAPRTYSRPAGARVCQCGGRPMACQPDEAVEAAVEPARRPPVRDRRDAGTRPRARRAPRPMAIGYGGPSRGQLRGVHADRTASRGAAAGELVGRCRLPHRGVAPRGGRSVPRVGESPLPQVLRAVPEHPVFRSGGGQKTPAKRGLCEVSEDEGSRTINARSRR